MDSDDKRQHPQPKQAWQKPELSVHEISEITKATNNTGNDGTTSS